VIKVIAGASKETFTVESTIFRMKLPATQDYIVQVVPRAGQVVSYTMNVMIK
jgi:hypothetical protein